MRQRLVIPNGINIDDTAFKFPGTWRDCDQVRFWKGSAEVVGGWESATTTLLGGVCRTAFTWVDRSTTDNIALGCHNKLYVMQNDQIYDITPTIGFTAGSIDGTGGAGYGTGVYDTGSYGRSSATLYYPLTWSFANWGESLMANPRGQTIFWWQNATGTPAAALTNAPSVVNFTLVTYTRQVMAFGCNEEISTNFNPMCIRFSDVENPTVWNTASNNNAGEVILEGGGRIIAARSIGDYIFVWTDNALFQGSYTGDNYNPWVFVKIGDNCGLAGPNAATVVAQTAYWFSSQGRFMSCSLGGVPDILQLMVGDDMSENVSPVQNDKIVASPISRYNEIWWFYPDQRDGIENSRYVSISLEDGSASKGTIARTAFCDTPLSINKYPIGVSYSGNIYYHEKGITQDGANRTWYIETSDFFIDEQEHCMMIKTMWPDFQRQVGPINMTLTGLQYPQSDPVVFSDQVLTNNTTKIDFRFSGRLIRMKLSGNSSFADMRLGIPTLDITPAGDR